MSARAVIFDLDGVLVTTDELHFRAWKSIADELGIPFDRERNDRLRGVSRMESLEILLGGGDRDFSVEEKQKLAARKNERYRASLESLSSEAILPGAVELIDELRARGVKLAVASSSRNARTIMEKTGLIERVPTIVDGNDIHQSKPNPEVFLKAAERLGVEPRYCVVVEDAKAGVEAGLRAGMRVLGVGAAPEVGRAHRVVTTVAEMDAGEVVSV